MRDRLNEGLLERPQTEKVSWNDLKTGDIVKIMRGEFFPSDLILLRSSEPKNLCYVETKNLDGETNLKHKVAPKSLFEMYRDEVDMVDNLKGTVICEAPHDLIYRFQGVIQMTNSEKISLTHENFLLRGSSL